MSDIFISYASADRERAKLLSKALQRRNWSAWWDRTIPPGKEYDQVIEEALDSSRCVVVLWSHASVASSWVKTEAAEAMRRKILVPALIEDAKIPLEFRRLQAADLSQWHGEPDHPGLEEFFQSIDRKIHGSGVTEAAVVPAVPLPPPVQPPAPIQPRHWTRAAWPAVAVIAVLVGAASGLTLWRSQQDQSGPSVPAHEVSPPAQAVRPASSVPAVSDVVDRPEPVRPPPSADARVTDRPAATSSRPLPREPGRVADASSALTPSKPAGGAPAEVKPVTPTALPESPTTPPAAAPSESPTTPVRSTNLPVASPKQFEGILLMVTKEGETEELDALLLFGDTSLVLKDEDSQILRTLPYSNVQKATYSRTQRRIMLVRTTRHWLTLGVGREEVVLRLPDETHLSILSQIEQRTGVTIVRRVE
jgi:TIR domain